MKSPQEIARTTNLRTQAEYLARRLDPADLVEIAAWLAVLAHDDGTKVLERIAALKGT